MWEQEGFDMKTKIKQKLDLSAYFYIAPAVILMAVFIFYALGSSFYISLTNWKGLGAMKFIGFDNYVRLVKDATFWNSIKLQLIWALLSVVLLALSGLIFAIMIEFVVTNKRLQTLFRTVLFMPMMMSLIAIGLLWSLVYNPSMGLLNEGLHFLGLLGSGKSIDLLGNYDLAIFAVFVPALWQWSGFGMVIFSAAIKGIPQDIIEASIVDGCSLFGRIKYVILPFLRPSIMMVCTLNLIGGLKCFDLIYAMTGGGPGTSTLVTSIYQFKQAFVNSSYGYSATISFVLFIITVLLGLGFFSISKRVEN